jgi:hypothetical protein
MAYDTNELIRKSIEILDYEKGHTVFIEDLIVQLGISKQAFYNHKLDENDDIKERLERNKVATKNYLRKKWFNSNNPTLQISLYKILANDFEYARLNNNPVVNNVTNNFEMTEEYIIEAINQLIKDNPNIKDKLTID